MRIRMAHSKSLNLKYFPLKWRSRLATVEKINEFKGVLSNLTQNLLNKRARMKLPLVPDLLAVASRVIWFEPPDQALADPIRFLAYLMNYGTANDIAVVRHYLDLDDFREALDQAPPGIFDEASWVHWNGIVGRNPPPLPRRVIPD